MVWVKVLRKCFFTVTIIYMVNNVVYHIHQSNVWTRLLLQLFSFFLLFSTLYINIQDMQTVTEIVWNSVNNKVFQFHGGVTWTGFPAILKELPVVLSTCWLLFLHFPVQLIPNYLSRILISDWGGEVF